MCLFVLYTGARPVDVAVCIGLYLLRIWAITAGYHRYFAHRTYKTGRVFQFVLAWVGSMSVQKGVLWWAAHHRHHHRESDTEKDIHSPVQRGFWFSHVGWIL
jgi:stearoyl-CoA desaturase (delta-9 desaturase)